MQLMYLPFREEIIYIDTVLSLLLPQKKRNDEHDEEVVVKE